MILSAALLSVFTVYYAFYIFALQSGGVKPHVAEVIVMSLLRAIPYTYLLIILFEYFRHQGWKVLQYTLLLMVIFEIVTKAFTIINQVGSLVPHSFKYSMVEGGFWFFVIIIQAIFLLRLPRAAYPAVFPLQKYAIALILFQLIAFGIPLLFSSGNFSSMMLVIRIISAIPYLFLIEFALKLDLNKRSLVSDNVL